MILDSKKPILDYKGDPLTGDKNTMKDLALDAFEGAKIDDPAQAEIAGIAMGKIYKGEPLNDQEKAMTKVVMMAIYHPRYLDYISKQFDDGNTNTKG